MAQTLVTKCQSLGAPQLTQAWRQKKDKSWTPQAGLRLASQRRQALRTKMAKSWAQTLKLLVCQKIPSYASQNMTLKALAYLFYHCAQKR